MIALYLHLSYIFCFGTLLTLLYLELYVVILLESLETIPLDFLIMHKYIIALFIGYETVLVHRESDKMG